MKEYKSSQIFVPGGMPLHTYVARSERNLENKLRSATDNLCELVTITGATKSLYRTKFCKASKYKNATLSNFRLG
jgi:hypothetical protein